MLWGGGRTFPHRGMCSFPGHPRLGGLNHTYFSRFWRLEVQDQGVCRLSSC